MNTSSNTPTEIPLRRDQKETIRNDIKKYLLSEIQKGSNNFQRELFRIDLFDLAHIGVYTTGEYQESITFDSDTILNTEDWLFIKNGLIKYISHLLGEESIGSEPLFMSGSNELNEICYYCLIVFTPEGLEKNRKKYGNIVPIEIDPRLQVAQTIYAILDPATQKNHVYIPNIAKKLAKERTRNDRILLKNFNEQFMHILTHSSDDK